MGIETAIVLGALAVGGATAYSAHQESKAAKKAAEMQSDVAKMEIQAQKESSILASKEAKNKLKLAQARKTKTILTPPMGVDENTNKSILGV